MSVQTLYTAATGMEALQTKLDVIANNLANVNTTGFKGDMAVFKEQMQQAILRTSDRPDGLTMLPGGDPTFIGKMGTGGEAPRVTLRLQAMIPF